MKKLISEMSDSELVVLKCLCDIFNSSHEHSIIQVACHAIYEIADPFGVSIEQLSIDVENEQQRRIDYRANMEQEGKEHLKTFDRKLKLKRNR